MRTFLSVLCSAMLLLFPLSGCRSGAAARTVEYYDLFDTYSYLTVYDISEEELQTVNAELHAYLLRLHQLMDIYHSYAFTNLYAINAAAGTEPLPVDPVLLDFLSWCRDAYTLTDGRVNVLLGAVTSLWHDAREQAAADPAAAALPSSEALQNASLHTDIDSLVLDREAGTVCLTDADASLDVGALAKGYAGRLAVQFLQARGIENFLLSLGGNICAFGSPVGTGRDFYQIGIEDPSGSGAVAQSCRVQNQCVVTSGDYQRYFEVDGTRYHHIIDPDTLYPSRYQHSVTIIHSDSAMADLLSTALFLMPEDEGRALAARYDAQVIY